MQCVLVILGELQGTMSVQTENERGLDECLDVEQVQNL